VFISRHVDEFYSLAMPVGKNAFDFKPTGSGGVKVALRRYIASHVFELVAGMVEDISMGTHGRTPTMTLCSILIPHPQEFDQKTFALRLHQNLQPYTHGDATQKVRWKGHLEDIMIQGSELARMLSSQPGSRWEVGSLDPPISNSGVLVFPALFKNGNEIRAKEAHLGEGKPKRNFGVATLRKRNWSVSR
jgi:hypothetical protein